VPVVIAVPMDVNPDFRDETQAINLW
jgi:hypothetical protein